MQYNDEAILQSLGNLHGDDLSELLNLITDYIEEQPSDMPLPEPVEKIVWKIRNKIALGYWDNDAIVTGFWVLGKAVFSNSAPDLVLLAANVLPQIDNNDACYQILISIHNQIMAKRSIDRESCLLVLAGIRENPELWSEDPNLLNAVIEGLEESTRR